MNDKLLILEDTDGDGKADKMHRLRRRPAQPDRLRVLQRRRARRPGPGPVVPQGHRRRRQGRRARARPARPRLGRHAPHRQQLRARPRRRALLPGRHVPPHAGRDALRPAGAAAPTPASSATSRGRRSSTSTSPTASPTRTATSSTAGARTSSSTAPGPHPYHAAAVLRPPRLSRTSTRRPPQVYQQRTRPCPGIEILSSRHFPRRDAGQPARRQRDRLPGHPAATRSSDDGSSFSGDGARADPVVEPTRTSARRDLKIGPDGAHLLHRLAQPDHRPHAAQPPRPEPRPRARPHLPRHLRGPAAARSPRRSPASRSTKLLDLLKQPEDRVRYRARIELSGRTTDRRDRRREEVDRRARHEATRTTSTTCSKALWLHQSHNVVDAELLEARAGVARTSAPAPRRRACCATGATACRTRSTCCKKLAADDAPARAAGGGAGGELLHRAGGGRGRRSIAAGEADGPVPRLRPRRDDAGARPASSRRPSRRASRSSSRRRPGPRTSCENVGTDDLLKMKRTPGVYLELLFRPGVRDEFRREALDRAGEAREEERAAACCSTRSATTTTTRSGPTRASPSTWSAC